METKKAESHHITLYDRTSMQLSGIVKVVSLTPERVELLTEHDRLTIRGQDLHTEKLDMEKKELMLAGTVQAILYTTGRKAGAAHVAKRLFG